ncbi:hypothetical protein Lesp02_78260 [Lentzea sp. NBRC 105346]|uniref:hypothetical protein n=1 Tax=Lentzea sp. NBRC 105346 TaxID=3032205 RepID=UPI0024A0649E|nr:hypothetical protein [Lentzea sp. NBRC 105346]GLZ35639.1 hypothetical protein Lesp02_78260 [Lentzea sp. NBRC 105346]
MKLALALAVAGSLAMSGTAYAQNEVYAGDTYSGTIACGQNELPLVMMRSDAFVGGYAKIEFRTFTATIVDTPGTYEVVSRCARANEIKSSITVLPKKPPTPQPKPQPKPQPQVKVRPVGPPQTGGGGTA